MCATIKEKTKFIKNHITYTVPKACTTLYFISYKQSQINVPQTDCRFYLVKNHNFPDTSKVCRFHKKTIANLSEYLGTSQFRVGIAFSNKNENIFAI